jgi:hypothetical protein
MDSDGIYRVGWIFEVNKKKSLSAVHFSVLGSVVYKPTPY